MSRASDPIKAHAAAAAIVERLRAAGHTAYFAGGCVRDALLNLEPTDFDIATDATPPRITDLFPHTAEVGAAFGVVLVHQSLNNTRVSVEVATFRSDGPYSDSRRPDTVHFSTPQEDAARRDFTINALFLDPLAPPDSQVIDYVGGVADLDRKLIRAVGDPDRRLAEDHLRALRAVRFAARLNFDIDDATSAALTRHASELRGVSRERIGDELRKILIHPARARAAALLQDLALDAPVLTEPPRRADLIMLRGLDATQESASLPLAAWALDRAGASSTGLGDESIADLARRWRAALCLSNDESAELAAILRGHQYLIRAWTNAAIARQKRWAASPWFPAALALIKVVNEPASQDIIRTVESLSSDKIGLAPPPHLDGNGLIAAGFEPGPPFRRVLEAVYDAQLEGRITNPTQALELARQLYV